MGEINRHFEGDREELSDLQAEIMEEAVETERGFEVNLDVAQDLKDEIGQAEEGILEQIPGEEKGLREKMKQAFIDALQLIKRGGRRTAALALISTAFVSGCGETTKERELAKENAQLKREISENAKQHTRPDPLPRENESKNLLKEAQAKTDEEVRKLKEKVEKLSSHTIWPQLSTWRGPEKSTLSLEEMKMLLQEKESALARLEQELISAKVDVKKDTVAGQQELIDLTKEYESLIQKRLAEIKKEIRNEQVKIDGHERRISDPVRTRALNREINDQKQNLELEDVKNDPEKKKLVEESIESLRSDPLRMRLSSEIDQANRKIEDLRKERENLEKRGIIGDIDAKAVIRDRAAAIEKRIAYHQGEIKRLQAQVQELEIEVRGLKNGIKNFREYK